MPLYEPFSTLNSAISFQKFFAELARIYASEPALYVGEYDPRCFEWVACESSAEGVYAWLRRGRGQCLLCVMNTQDKPHKQFPLYLAMPAAAEELLCTEAPQWGGGFAGETRLHTVDGGVYGRDYTLFADLPAMGSRLFRLTPEAPHPGAAKISAANAAKKARAANARAARAAKKAAAGKKK